MYKQNLESLETFRLPVDIGSAAAVERIHGLLDKLKQEWEEQVSKRTVYKPEDMNAKDDIIAQLEQTNDELVAALRRFCYTLTPELLPFIPAMSFHRGLYDRVRGEGQDVHALCRRTLL